MIRLVYMQLDTVVEMQVVATWVKTVTSIVIRLVHMKLNTKVEMRVIATKLLQCFYDVMILLRF